MAIRYGAGLWLSNRRHARPVQCQTDPVFGDRGTSASMTAIPLETLVTVFGGSGFLGRHVVRALAKLGYRIRVAVRRPELAGFLQPLGRVGQIHAVQANLRHPASVEAAARDGDVVIDLVGILSERGRQNSTRCRPLGPKRSRSQPPPSVRA